MSAMIFQILGDTVTTVMIGCLGRERHRQRQRLARLARPFKESLPDAHGEGERAPWVRSTVRLSVRIGFRAFFGNVVKR